MRKNTYLWRYDYGSVETEDFELIVRLCGMFSLSTKLIKEQALAIQNMNEKLDKLLNK